MLTRLRLSFAIICGSLLKSRGISAAPGDARPEQATSSGDRRERTHGERSRLYSRAQANRLAFGDAELAEFAVAPRKLDEAKSKFGRGPVAPKNTAVVYSDFNVQRLDRLHRTLDAMLKLTFDNSGDVARASQRINAVHRCVCGR